MIARIIAILLAAACLAAAGRAAAHAILLESYPPDGAALNQPPQEMFLRFNEPVTPILLDLIGPDGEKVDLLAGVAVINEILRSPFPNGGEGGYFLNYRVLSVDTHPVAGSIPFIVGQANPASPRAEKLERSSPWIAFAQRASHAGWLFLHLALVGAAIFAALFSPGRAPRRVRLRLAVALVSLGAVSFGFKGLALLDAGVEALASFAPWRAAWASAYGARFFICTLATACAMAALSSRGAAVRAFAAAGAVFFGLGLAQSGHAASHGVGWILAIHGVLAAFWLGSLFGLLAQLRDPSAKTLLDQFSGLALPAVLLLALLGGVLAWLIAGPFDLSFFTAPGYGAWLAIKVLLVGVLCVLAAANRWLFSPGLDGPSPGQVRLRLRRSIRAEIACFVALVGATAFLSHTSPHERAAGHGPHEAAMVASVDYQSGGWRMRLALSQPLSVAFFDPSGVTIQPVEVIAEFRQEALGIQSIRRVLQSDGAGGFALLPPSERTSGLWQIRVEALVNDFERRGFDFEMEF